MKQKLLRLSLWLLAGALALLLIFFGILYLNRDKIKSMAIEETNKLLEVPVAVDAIEVSLRKFPHASLRFSEVYSRGRGNTENDTLFFAKALYFEFDLWQVFSDDLSIKKISAENGLISVIMPEEGLPNYHIWKEDTSTNEDGFFTLEEVSLSNFNTRFQHASSTTEIYGFVNNYWLSGNFGTENLALRQKASLMLDSVLVEKENYFQTAAIETEFLLEGIGELFMIKEATASLNNIPLVFRILSQESGVEIEANAPALDLAKFTTLAQAQNWSWPENTSLNGEGNLTYYSVHPSGNEDFSIKADLHFKNAKITGLSDARISGVKGVASYTYKNGVDELNVKEIYGKGETGSIEGALRMKDLQQPFVVLDLKSDLSLEEWMLFVPMDTITEPKGRISLNLHLENKFKDIANIQPRELARAKTRGSIQLKEVGFGLVNSTQQVNLLNGELNFQGSDLNIQNFYVKIADSDVYLKGYFKNALNYAFFDNEKLAVKAKVISQNIDLKDFLSGTESSSDTAYNLSFAQSLDMDLDLEVGRLVFNTFSARDIRGNLSISKGVINGNGLVFNADEGSYSGRFSLDTKPVPHPFTAELNTQQISLHHVFLSFNNFDQEAILAENIYGKTDIHLEMTARVSPNLEVYPSSIDLEAQVLITDGAIRNYEPMTALSDYADLEELKNVEFNKLKNSIRIKNSIITIPRMEIESNVMNLGLEGTHSFENIVDYNITLELSEVLFSKRKKKDRKSEFDKHLVVVENEDEPTVQVQMRGPALDPEINIKRLNVVGEKEPTKLFSKDPEPDTKKAGIRYNLFVEDQDTTSR